MKRKWVLSLIILFVLIPGAVSAEDDLSSLEQAVEQADAASEGAFSLKDLYTKILSGDYSFDPKALLQGGAELLRKECISVSSLFSQLLLLGVIAGIFGVFIDDFADGSAAKVGRWVLFLAFLRVSLDTFHSALTLGSQAVTQAADFLYAVLPVLLGAFALTGGAVSATVVQPTILCSVSLFLFFTERFFLPLLLIMAVAVICSDLTPRGSLRKFYELTESVFLLSLAFMMTVFTGLLGVEGFAAGTMDGLTLKTAKMAAGNFIPVVGGYVSDAFDSILGAGLLMRSSIGVFGVVGVAAVILLPALKILITAFLFKITSAVLQPFGVDPYVTVLSDFSAVLLSLFALVAVTGLFFFFLIFCIVGVSGMTMMFR